MIAEHKTIITFIIPAFNAQKSIAQCLESVLSQEVKKEIVAVDNASTDQTPQIIKNYPVRYIYETKRSPAAAKNRGLKECNSQPDYIAFVDSDVILPKRWTLKALELLEKNPHVAAVGGPGRSIIKNRVSFVFDYLLYGSTNRPRSKTVNSLATMNVIYKRTAISGLLFNEKLIAAEDPDLNFRVINKGYKLLYSRDLWVYHYNPTKIQEICKKWFNYGKFYPLPYFLNSRFSDFSLWIRILFLPILFAAICLTMIYAGFILIPLLLGISLPISYLVVGLKSGITEGRKLFLFSTLHSLKQLSQMLGIWYGFITRTFIKQ